MLRSRLQSQLQLLALPQLLSSARGGSSSLSLPTATGAAVTAAAVAGAPADSRHAVQLQPLRWFAAEPEPDGRLSGDVARAAHELGLDTVPFEELKTIMDPIRNKPQLDDTIAVSGGHTKQRKLTYQDLQGYKQWVEAFKDSPEDYADHIPNTPVVDASQWIEANFKDVGWSMEPRGPFYVWRAWAAAHLPQDQLETLLCVHEVMGDEATRSAFVKQAQHELARLWDWQQRRAALGLAPDLPPSAAAEAVAATSSSSSSSNGGFAASIPGSGSEEAAAAATVAVDVEGPQEDAAAAADDVYDNVSSSSSSKDEATFDPVAAFEDIADKDVLDVLEEAEARDAAVKAAAAAARAQLDVPDVADTTPSQHQSDVASRARPASRDAVRAVEDVEYMLKQGKHTDQKGQYIQKFGAPLRVYKPVAHDGDIFLPTWPLGNRQVAEALADSERTRPVNPDKIREQAEWVMAVAQRSSTDGSTALGANAAAAAAVGATWTSMPLLDRTILHEEDARQEAERLAARPKRELPWQLLDDGYTFDLQQRPPTKNLDLLTSYLEIKYADVLLQKDAVQSMQRQLAVQAVRSRSTLASEVLEQPPTALTASTTLSPAERDAVRKTLDDMLGSKQYERYREAVLQLYSDGLVSWGELQECWAAAQAGEELTAAAEAPVNIAGDRDMLFRVLAGQQQLTSLSSSSSSNVSSATASAAACKAWEEAAQKLQASWAAGSSSSSDSSSSSSADWWANRPVVSYEEAEQTWQQLLHLAGQSNGPRFDQVLLASSSSSSDDVQQQQQQLLQQLQEALQKVFGLKADQVEELAGLGSSSNSIEPGELQQQLQQAFGEPPTLENVLQRHWQKVSQQELGHKLKGWPKKGEGPSWSQMWQLLQSMTAQQQQQQQRDEVAATVDNDAATQFDKYVRETEGVALTPPPYPGARRLLRWEQRMMLHPASGQVVVPAELKVKLAVSAAELQQETGLSKQGLQYLLAVAGKRYDPASGDLTISCDRFPTREENRRWCLEVLHRLLQTAQGRYPSDNFWVDSSALGVPAGNPIKAAAGRT